jgi:hypothetical protein
MDDVKFLMRNVRLTILIVSLVAVKAAFATRTVAPIMLVAVWTRFDDRELVSFAYGPITSSRRRSLSEEAGV